MVGLLKFAKTSLKFNLTAYFHDNDLFDYASDTFSSFLPDETPLTADDDIMLCGIAGPTSLKYAVFIGYKAFGILGALISLISSLVFPILVTVGFYLFYNLFYLKSGLLMSYIQYGFNGALSVALGLFVSHILKLHFNNKISRKSYIFIVIAALIYMVIVSVVDNLNSVVAPYFILVALAVSFLMGNFKYYWEKRRARLMELYPERFKIDPYSRKAIKMRDRALMEEEEEMRK